MVLNWILDAVSTEVDWVVEDSTWLLHGILTMVLVMASLWFVFIWCGSFNFPIPKPFIRLSGVNSTSSFSNFSICRSNNNHKNIKVRVSLFSFPTQFWSTNLLGFHRWRTWRPTCRRRSSIGPTGTKRSTSRSRIGRPGRHGQAANCRSWLVDVWQRCWVKKRGRNLMNH